MTAPARTSRTEPPRPSARRLTAAGVADLFIPGLGHAFVGRPRAAALFFIPFGLAILGLLLQFLSGGWFARGDSPSVAVVAWIVSPGVLPLLVVANLAFAAWRLLAALDAARGTTSPKLAFGVLVPAAFLFVLVPHLWLGSTLSAASSWIDATFANGPEVTQEPDETPPPGWTYAPDTDETDAPTLDPSFTIDPNITPAPTGTPRPPMTAGTGTLPALNVTVPWQRPGAVPWGDDGRFDLLLLGSDAGPDRWSRRMDVMLLVEIDVNTGKVAMIGLPRNLLNAPFPPGPARDAVACGCLKDLLNSLYVEATVRHPDRWPGTGAVAGIGAVRSVVSEITGRPVDAVLVADLWGMLKVVDAMGGIDIDIPYAVHDDNYPDPVYGHIAMSLPAGKQHLDGRHALFYARSRHQDSDYGRMARQQTLLLAIRDQIGPSTILNAPDLFNAAKGFTWTDLPRSSLPNLVELFGKASHASVKQLRIVPPTYPEYLTSTELTKIRNAVAALLGLPTPPTPSPSVAPTGTAPAPTPSHTPGPMPTDTPTPTETPPPPTEAPAPT